MKKELGPMAKLHGGPDNKALGGKNSTGLEAMSRISKNIPPKSDTIRVSKKYKPGDFVEEYELEKEIKKQTGAFPQLSVQDYSKVKVDDRGRNIVVKLEKGPQATDPDIKAAKKEIRRGANVLGGGNIVDDFGHKHGYQSAKTKELDNSRLVQRKKRQYVKQEAKSNIKRYRGKDNRKGFKSDEFTTGMSNLRGKEFTAKDGNKARKDEIKSIKKNSKDTRRSSRLNAKANRIKARAAGPQATRPPRGTKEEKFKRKQDERNERVKNRLDKNLEKKLKKSSRVQSKLDDGRITEALADQKQRKIFKYNEKKDNRKRFNYNR